VRRLAIATALTVAFAGVAAAQTVATPVYLAPYRAFTDYEIGGAFSAPGGGFAIEGAYRYGMDRFDVGFRLGMLDGDGDNINALLAGVEARTRILEHSEDFPLDGALMAGIGTQLGDGYAYGIIPVGFSLGRRVDLDNGMSLISYLQPTLGVAFGDTSENIVVSLGIGLDFKLSRRLDLRVNGGIGDIDGIAIGLSWVK
jgi:hypothetical protein